MWSQTFLYMFWPVFAWLGTHDLWKSHRDEFGKLDLFGIPGVKKGSFGCWWHLREVLRASWMINKWREQTNHKRKVSTWAILRKRASEKEWRQRVKRKRVKLHIQQLWSSWGLLGCWVFRKTLGFFFIVAIVCFVFVFLQISVFFQIKFPFFELSYIHFSFL